MLQLELFLGPLHNTEPDPQNKQQLQEKNLQE